MHHQNITVCCLINYSVNINCWHRYNCKSWNPGKPLMWKISTGIKMPDKKAALLQLHLYSRLNTWLQCIGQRQLRDNTGNIFGTAYIRGFTVFTIRCWFIRILMINNVDDFIQVFSSMFMCSNAVFRFQWIQSTVAVKRSCTARFCEIL